MSKSQTAMNGRAGTPSWDYPEAQLTVSVRQSHHSIGNLREQGVVATKVSPFHFIVISLKLLICTRMLRLSRHVSVSSCFCICMRSVWVRFCEARYSCSATPKRMFPPSKTANTCLRKTSPTICRPLGPACKPPIHCPAGPSLAAPVKAR